MDPRDIQKLRLSCRDLVDDLFSMYLDHIVVIEISEVEGTSSLILNMHALEPE